MRDVLSVNRKHVYVQTLTAIAITVTRRQVIA
jgi:hypothetical protein